MQTIDVCVLERLSEARDYCCCRHEIDKLVASQRLDMNLEKGWVLPPRGWVGGWVVPPPWA